MNQCNGNDFSDVYLNNIPDCSLSEFLANIEPFGSSGSTSNNMTVKYSSSCPVDHSQDADIVQNFYKTIRSYSLPRIPNVTLQTIHRCNLNEIGPVLNSTGVGGDGGTAAVIVRDGVNVGIIYISTQRQAEAICDIITCVLLGLQIGDVSQKLVGSQAVQYIKDVML